MEESLDPAADAAEFRRHLVTMHGQPDVDWLPQDWGKHARDHEDAVRAREIGEPLEAYTGYRPHPYDRAGARATPRPRRLAGRLQPGLQPLSCATSQSQRSTLTA